MEFAVPVLPKAIEIYETYRGGFLHEIFFKSDEGDWVSAWNDYSYKWYVTQPRIFSPVLRIGDSMSKCKVMKLVFDTYKKIVFNIDAVKLIGYL